MDVATHAVTGAVAWLACKNRPQTAWGLPLAMAAAASPDADVFFAGTPLEFLLLHRGITHSLAAMPFMAFILALLMDSLWRKSTPGAWRFSRVMLFAAALLAMHIWLDCVTTYGTMIFTPFSDYRVRLNGLFIVDFLLLLPLLGAWIFGRKNRAFALLGAAWIFVYPAFMVGERIWLERQWTGAISAAEAPGRAPQQTDDAGPRGAVPEARTPDAGNGRPAPYALHVLPDVFAPARWRVVYEKEDEVRQIALDWRGRYIAEEQGLAAADPGLMARLSAADRSCRAFFSFTMLPVQKKISSDANGTEMLFYDLRFSTMIPFAHKIMSWRANGATPFMLVVKLDENGALQASRMIFSGGGRASDFAPPDPPGRVSPWQWLAGIK